MHVASAACDGSYVTHAVSLLAEGNQPFVPLCPIRHVASQHNVWCSGDRGDCVVYEHLFV